jgi:anthranilate phosphoribosyltransferase
MQSAVIAGVDMTADSHKQFGTYITRLIQGESLSKAESQTAFYTILNDETTAMQQGAFLAALAAKGETEEEVAGGWKAIYDLDTIKAFPQTDAPMVENSGTGMDTFKTFNISTAASLVAAAGGIAMVRHGARAITSKCGTVDMAEALGVNVECKVNTVVNSIEQAGIGLFNGMSPEVHPMALGRILSNIYFGSSLNIAASLANPALPKLGVRGVYAENRIIPVAKVMKAIGYKRALVFYGTITNSGLGMDEASVCGITHGAELMENGQIEPFILTPEEFGLSMNAPESLASTGDLDTEARDFIALVKGKKNGARKEAIVLNAGLIFYIAGKSGSISDGVNQAVRILEKGHAYDTLENWVSVQNDDSESGLRKLRQVWGE